MKTRINETPLKDLLTVEIDYFTDERGFFIEPWNKRDFREAGIDIDFLQEGHSQSKKDVLRGLHYQNMSAPMAKLVRCTVGEVYDVAVDLRSKSKTFGQWFGVILSAENKKQIFIPVGFAHGFLTLSNTAEVQYKQSNYYTPSAEGSIIWNDSDLKIDWQTSNPILSEKDKKANTFKQYSLNPDFL